MAGNPNQAAAQTRLMEMTQNRAQFLAGLQMCLPSLSPQALMMAILQTRSILPRSVRPGENPLAQFSPELVTAVMGSLMQLFGHDNLEIATQAAISFGRYTAFSISVDPATPFLVPLLQTLTGTQGEQSAITAATALMEIVDQNVLAGEASHAIFAELFNALGSQTCPLAAKSLCIEILTLFEHELMEFIAPNPQLFVQILLTMSSQRIMAAPAFMHWSNIAEMNYGLLSLAPTIFPLSLETLTAVKGVTDDAKTDELITNILRFWTLVSQKEIYGEDHGHITATFIQNIVPLFYEVFLTRFEDTYGDEDWTISTAASAALIAACQAEPEKFSAIIAPVIAQGCPVLMYVHAMYAILESRNMPVIQSGAELAVNSVNAAFTSGSTPEIRYAFMILGELAGIINLPSDFVTLAFQFIASGESELREKASTFVIEFARRHNEDEALITGVINTCLQIIGGTGESEVISCCLDLITTMAQIHISPDFCGSLIPQILTITGGISERDQNDEAVDASIALLATLTIKGGQLAIPFAEPLFRLVGALQGSCHRANTLKIICALSAILGAQFQACLPQVFGITDELLNGESRPEEIIVAFRSITLIQSRCDISAYVPHVVEQALGYLKDANSETMETFSSIIFSLLASMIRKYHPLLAPYVAIIDMAIGYGISFWETVDDLDAFVDIPDCCCQMLQWEIPAEIKANVIVSARRILELLATRDVSNVSDDLLVIAGEIIVILAKMVPPAELFAAPAVVAVAKAVASSDNEETRKLMSQFAQ